MKLALFHTNIFYYTYLSNMYTQTIIVHLLKSTPLLYNLNNTLSYALGCLSTIICLHTRLILLIVWGLEQGL